MKNKLLIHNTNTKKDLRKYINCTTDLLKLKKIIQGLFAI